MGACETMFVIMIVSDLKITVADTNVIITNSTDIGVPLVVASLAEGVALEGNVPFPTQVHVTIPTTEMSGVPVLFHGFDESTFDDELREKRLKLDNR